MSERRHKRVEDMGESGDDSGILLEQPARIELGSGYSLSFSLDENEKPVVNIKTYGEVDLARLRREIKGIFPNAQIRQKGQIQMVTVTKKSTKKLLAAKKRSRKRLPPRNSI